MAGIDDFAAAGWASRARRPLTEIKGPRPESSDNRPRRGRLRLWRLCVHHQLRRRSGTAHEGRRRRERARLVHQGRQPGAVRLHARGGAVLVAVHRPPRHLRTKPLQRGSHPHRTLSPARFRDSPRIGSCAGGSRNPASGPGPRPCSRACGRPWTSPGWHR